MLTRVYNAFCKAELWLAACMLMAIAALVFLSAIARTVGSPINWATDISLLLFAWLVFLGGDIVIREGHLISVDMFLNKFPSAVRKTLVVVFLLMMLAFLAILVRYGIPLLLANKKRMFQATNISYSWCTLSVVVGSFLMGISTCVRLVKEIKGGPAQSKADGKEAEA